MELFLSTVLYYDREFFLVIENQLLYSTIIIASIVGTLLQMPKSSIYTAWMVYFIGTVFHELSHWIVSLVTFGKPVSLNLLPKKVTTEDSSTLYYLGYVESANSKWYNTFFISFAPLLLLPLSYYIFNFLIDYINESAFLYILTVFLTISLVFSSIPSSVDFKNVINGKILLNLFIPAILLVLIIIIHYGVDL